MFSNRNIAKVSAQLKKELLNASCRWRAVSKISLNSGSLCRFVACFNPRPIRLFHDDPGRLENRALVLARELHYEAFFFCRNRHDASLRASPLFSTNQITPVASAHRFSWISEVLRAYCGPRPTCCAFLHSHKNFICRVRVRDEI